LNFFSGSIIEAKKIRDWTHNTDVQDQMTNEIEDCLYSIKGRYDLPLSYDEIDEVLEQVIHTTKPFGTTYEGTRYSCRTRFHLVWANWKFALR
jgi:hypothetical protein